MHIFIILILKEVVDNNKFMNINKTEKVKMRKKELNAGTDTINTYKKNRTRLENCYSFYFQKKCTKIFY